MGAAIEGGCLCGGVRWAYDGDAGEAGYCHCVDCRRVTGSAFNVSVRLLTSRFRVAKGVVKAFTKIADSGREITRSFCPDCGSPLFTTSTSAHPDLVYVKAGSFDDPSLVCPAHQSWTSRAVPWAAIDGAIQSHARGRSR